MSTYGETDGEGDIDQQNIKYFKYNIIKIRFSVVYRGKNNPSNFTH